MPHRFQERFPIHHLLNVSSPDITKTAMKETTFSLYDDIELFQSLKEASQSSYLDQYLENDPTGGECPFPLPRFKYWYNAIKNDDIVAYEKVKDTVSKSTFKILLNGKFKYLNKAEAKKTEEKLKRYRVHKKVFERPLALAIVYKCKCLIPLMIKDGVNVYFHDTGNSNAFHVLVHCVSMSPHLERDYVETYEFLRKQFRGPCTNYLLQDEDDKKYRPLELAAKWGTFGLFRSMLNDKGSLKRKDTDLGSYVLREYDVTEYESYRNRKRQLRCPVRLLQYVTNTSLSSMVAYKVHEMPLIKKWINHKFRSYKYWIAAWFLVRAFYFVLLLFLNPVQMLEYHDLQGDCREAVRRGIEEKLLPEPQHDGPPIPVYGMQFIPVAPEGNHSNEIAFMYSCLTGEIFEEYGWVIIITKCMLISYLFLVFDIIELIAWKIDNNRKNAQYGLAAIHSSFLVYTRFYRICKFILDFLCGLGAFAVGFSPKILWDLGLANVVLILKALYLPLLLITVLYMLEVLPFFRNFAFAIQKMLATLVNFIIVIGAVMVVFGSYFAMALPGTQYSNLTTAPYAVFLLFDGVNSFATNAAANIYLAHISFYCFTQVLLLNFLIAVMSNDMQSDAKIAELLISIRGSMVALLLEERMSMFCNVITCCFRFFKGEGSKVKFGVLLSPQDVEALDEDEQIQDSKTSLC